MIPYREFRKSKRFEHRTTVMFEDEPTGYFSYGQMINFSNGGMCFGSDVAFKPGAKIKIKLEKPIFKAAPKTYHGKVRWCKELADDDSKYFYGFGVIYF
jgi:hypothetical protein